jgi:transposase-like protein
MTTKHKSEDYKISAVEYYLVGDKSQVETCKIFKCSPRSLLRWVFSKNLRFLEISLKIKI